MASFLNNKEYINNHYSDQYQKNPPINTHQRKEKKRERKVKNAHQGTPVLDILLWSRSLQITSKSWSTKEPASAPPLVKFSCNLAYWISASCKTKYGHYTHTHTQYIYIYKQFETFKCIDHIFGPWNREKFPIRSINFRIFQFHSWNF